DGRHNEWKVWEEGEKYKLSLKTDDLNYSQGEYEISEEDFRPGNMPRKKITATRQRSRNS
ncbi:MAG: hypothetical protein IIT82_02560, partial [Selenomonas sp.]|nr:hypothetical protein [Selenomonas sp.]